MSHPFTFLLKENIASIRDIQKNPSKALQGLTRVMRGTKTMGFYLSNEEMDEFLEDMEAASSAVFKARIKKGRQEMKEGKTIPLGDLIKKYGV